MQINILVILAKKRSSKKDTQPRNHKGKKKQKGRYDHTKIPNHKYRKHF